jgi:hypothetical protein
VLLERGFGVSIRYDPRRSANSSGVDSGKVHGQIGVVVSSRWSLESGTPLRAASC